MKRVLIYLLTIIIGASIPIYFLLIWEPLKSKEVLSDNAISSITDGDNNITKSNEVVNNSVDIRAISLKQRENSNSLFNYLDSDRRGKLNSVLKKLSIVDLTKINDFFSNKDNGERVREGVELARKRMSLSDYEIFKNILENYIDLSILN